MYESRKINICFVLPEAYPYFYPKLGQVSGGAELQMFYLSTTLAKNEFFNVSFIVSDYNQENTNIFNVKLLKSFNAERNDGVFKKLRQAVKFIKILWKEKPDIVFSTTNNTMVLLCSLFSSFTKSKHIHRIAHNNDTGFKRIKEFGFLARLYSVGMRMANNVLVQNNEQQIELLQNFNKTSVIFKNGFFIKNGQNVNKTHILWVSRFQKWKKPYLFLELASKFKDEQFTMICPYNKKDKQAWEKLKYKAEEVGNINFIEKVPFNEIQEYFNKAKLFINTSDAEGFPNTFLQSAQAKTPIVSLNVNPDSFITNNNCGIFANGNFNNLLTQTEQLLKNKHELELKGENCFNYLKENHDIDIVGKQLEEIILKTKEST